MMGCKGIWFLVGRSTGFGEENDIYVWEYDFVQTNINYMIQNFVCRLEAS